MEKFLKILRIIVFLICLILILYFIVAGISHAFFREKYEKEYVEKFEINLKDNFVKVIIYCTSNKGGRKYKATITDKKVIDELLNASTIDYGTKVYSGQYNQFYLIRLEKKDGGAYIYKFNKSFSSQNNPCRKNIKFRGKLFPNPYNDCGQLGIFENTSISEQEIINHSYSTPKVGAYNLKLINLLEKYADNIPFNGKTKIPFYDKYDLREINTNIENKF
jgi:hypothetical protein